MNKQATMKILSAVQWWKTPLSAICLLCLFIIMSASCDANHINDNEEKHKTLAEMFYNAERQIILHHEDSARITIALIEKILADKLTDKEAETGVKIYNNLGYLCQFRLNNYSQALVYYNKGLVLSDKHDINTILPSLYHNIANIYHSFGDNEHAHHYFRLALEKARKHGKPKSVLLTLCTMAINKIEAGDFNDTDIDFPSHIIADQPALTPVSGSIHVCFYPDIRICAVIEMISRSNGLIHRCFKPRTILRGTRCCQTHYSQKALH